MYLIIGVYNTKTEPNFCLAISVDSNTIIMLAEENIAMANFVIVHQFTKVFPLVIYLKTY